MEYVYPSLCIASALLPEEAVERIERRQMRFQRVHQLAAEQAAERVEHQVIHVAQAVRAAEHEEQPRELPQLNERRKRERHERDLAEIQPADIAQVHTKRQQHQNVAHDLQHRAVKKRRQIRARIGEHERRLAQEIGHELKRHELDLMPAQPRRLRRIRQREEHERQHAQHVKQKQTAEHGAHPVEAARTHLPVEKRHGHQRRDERKRISRQPDTAQKICHDPCLPSGRSRPGFWHQYSPGRHHIAIVLAYSWLTSS